MATFSSLGVGAGVDLQSILTKLMAVERAPIQALDTKISATNSKISLYGALKSKLDALASAADTLQFPSRLSAISAASGDEKIATATALFSATLGSYSVEVVELAATQKSNTVGYNAGTTFTAGTITLTTGDPGGTTVNHLIDLSSGGPHTLVDIRETINTAAVGVKASIVTDSDSQDHLVLTSETSGLDGSFSLTTTMTASGLQTGLDSLTHFTTAADGEISIDGITVKSNSNDFSGAVAGLTFTAKSTGTTTITVGTDSAKISSALKIFVDSYNAAVTLIKSNSDYDSETKVAEAFNADSAARSVLSALASTRSQIPTELASASLKNLFEVGVSVDKTGLLTLDTTKLTQALATSTSGVTALVQAYGKSFSDMVAGLQSSTGAVTNKASTLNSLLTTYKNQQVALEVRVDNIEKGYRKQFTALDKLMSSMQITSSYLTQQLAGLSG